MASKKARKTYYQKNKDKIYAKQKDDPKYHASKRRHTLRRYGITDEVYEQMLIAQGGVCAICKTDTPQGLRKYFCVDHNHVTGKVRGLLCQSCNILVAYAEHKRLQEAYSYLQEYDPK